MDQKKYMYHLKLLIKKVDQKTLSGTSMTIAFIVKSFASNVA